MKPDTAGPSESGLRSSSLMQAMDRLQFTVTRPVAVLMVFLAIMVFGGFSARLLPVNLMPEISYPKLTVRTEYPGAAPAEVENDVARPLEEQLGVVTGLTSLSSVSTSGNCDVVLEFAWDTDMDDANQDVLERLDQIRATLPDGINAPLILRYDPSLDPVMVLSLSGEGERFQGVGGLKYLRRVAERSVKRMLEPVDGVAAVKVKGGLLEEIRVEVDEQALRRTGIAISQVTERLAAENVNVAGGNMREGATRYLIRTVNEFKSLDDLRALVIASQGGRDIRLRDLATITPGYEDREVITRVDTLDAVQIEVYKEADANIVEMAKLVRGRLEGGRGTRGVVDRIDKEHGATLSVVSDRSLFIESSIQEVLNTAVLGGLVAIFVLFFFLGEGKTTAIVGLAIPMSVIVTFAPLNLAGVSMNIMSLGGLALGIGMLVDNAIVVLESIYRCRQEGDDGRTATLRGTAEVGSAVAASTLTSIAVFFPMVFVEGIAGQLFGDLGLTVVFSLLASLAVALFFIPMISSRQWAQPGGLTGGGDRLGSTGALWLSTLLPRAAARGFREDLATLRAAWNAPEGLALALRRPLLVVRGLYTILRTLAHVCVEIPTRLVWVAMMVVSRVFVLLVGGVLWVVSKLVRPAVFVFGRGLDRLTVAYRGVVRGSVRHPGAVFAVVLGALGVSWWAVYQLDTELVPELHQGELSVELAYPVGTPLDITDASVAQVETRLRDKLPRLRAMVSTVGTERDDVDEGERGEHTATVALSLFAGEGQARAAELQRARADADSNPASSPDSSPDSNPDGETAADANTEAADTDRQGAWGATSSAPEVRDACGGARASAACVEQAALGVIREVTSIVPGVQTTVRRPSLFSFKTPVEVEIRGYDLEALATATDQVAERLALVEGLEDVRASIRPGSPEVQIVYDRDALSRLGLDIRVVAEQVRDKIQGIEATRFNRRDRKIPIRVRLDNANVAGVKELRELVVNPGGSRPVPLSAVAEIVVGRGPNEIRRVGQQRVGVVTANVEGIGLGFAAEGVAQAVASLDLPEGVSFAITGQSEEWATSSRSLYVALALSIFLVYVIMASQFESLLYPLIILVSIPLALVGVVLTLALAGIPVSVVVFLGVIMLAGIVVNNAIVFVDYVNRLKARGLSTLEALEEAGAVRLRPILMTTLTTVLGLIPMAFGAGDGAEIRQPMAITVIAGLACSTLLTLIVIPTVYALVDRLVGDRIGESPTVRLERELVLDGDLDAVGYETFDLGAPTADASSDEEGPVA